MNYLTRHHEEILETLVRVKLDQTFDLILTHAGLYFDHPEIVPDGLQGDYRFNKNDEPAIRSV